MAGTGGPARGRARGRARPRRRRRAGITIREVAARAGVSTATVSRVLNNHPSVTGDSRARVARAVRRLDYTPNAIARSLRARRTRTVGLILRDAANTNFSIVCKAVQDGAGRRGYDVLVVSSDGDPEKERHFVALLEERQVDGLVVYASDESRHAYARLVQRRVPLVLVESQVAGLEADQVLCDNFGGARQAVGHLLDLGHRHVEVFTGSPRRTPGRERLRGYQVAFAERGLAARPGWIHRVAELDEEGRRALADRLAGDDPPTALFAATAHLTIEVLGAVREARRLVGRDVSVVGFDNGDLAPLITPPLTTVERDLQRIGSSAVELLLDRLESDRDLAPRRVVIPTRLVVRGSCAPPRAARRPAAPRSRTAP